MKERNRSIDLFRYLCAILVVIIHTNPISDIYRPLGAVICQVPTRIAVPFFFLVSGYYYIKALGNGKKIFFSYIIRILRTYALWSVVYFIINFVAWGHRYPLSFITECLRSFFVSGSYYHFWFFPALICSVFLITVIYKVKLQRFVLPLSFALYIIGCLGSAYYSIGVHIPVLSILYTNSNFELIRSGLCIAFPFFAAGLLVDKIERYIKKRNISSSVINFVLVSAVVCWLIEIGIVVVFQFQQSIVITFGLYILMIAVMVFLLNHPLPQAKRLSEKCHFLADFTYYSHPAVMALLTFLANQLGYSSLPQTMMFLLVIMLTGGIGMGYFYFRKNSQDNKKLKGL